MAKNGIFCYFFIKNIFSHNYDVISVLISDFSSKSPFNYLNDFGLKSLFSHSYDVISVGKYAFYKKITKNIIFGHLVVIYTVSSINLL